MMFFEFTNVHEFFFEMIDSAILVIILAIVLHSYMRSRKDPKISQKALTYLAVAFGIEAVYQISQVIFTGVPFGVYESARTVIIAHALETLTFSVLGLALLRARVADKKKPLRALFALDMVALVAFTIFLDMQLGAVSPAVIFYRHWGHLVFELWHLAILVLIVILLFDVWRSTKARHLLILGVAFFLWAVAHVVHIWCLLIDVWFPACALMFHILETTSLLLLGAYVYTSARPRPKTLPDRYRMTIDDIIAQLLKIGVAPAIVLARKAAAEVHKKYPKRFTILIDDKGKLSGHADVETLDVFVEKLANMLGPRLKPLTERVVREICEKHRIIEAEETYADKLADLFTLA